MKNMLKTRERGFLSYFAVVVCSAAATLFASYLYQEAASNTGDGSATAEVLTVITITQTTEMDFGKLAASDTGATEITVTSAGAIDGSSTAHTVAGGTPSQGVFTITGEAGESVNITYTDGVVSNGTQTMALDVENPTSGANDSTATLTAGSATLNVGGTLTVAQSQASGTYTTALSGGSAYVVTAVYP